LRLRVPKFAIATMLTAIATTAVVAGIPAAGASVATIKGFACVAGDNPAFQLMNHMAELYILDIAHPDGKMEYELINNPGDRGSYNYFCPSWGVSHNGTEYYYLDDDNKQCMTVDTNASPMYTYEATCGEYPASQQWATIYNLYGEKEWMLFNYANGDCLWAAGQPPADASVVNVGACNLNENTGFKEEGNPLT
jgi:hypothetical protein